MKIIKLNESQYTRLFEDVTDLNFGNDPTKRFGAEVTNQALTSNDEYSRPLDTDDFADKQTPQQWGSVGGRKSSNTI
jgi:hypothetical protein